MTDGSVSGTVTLDQTTGVFTGSNLKMMTTGGTGIISGAPVLTSAGSNHFGNILKVVGTSYTFHLVLPVASLKGYTGGVLCNKSGTPACSGVMSGVYYSGSSDDPVMSGSLALVPAIATEPTSLLLVGTGLLAMAVVLRRHHA